jgi:hypothetical protein
MTVFVWLAVALAAGFVFVAVAYKRRWMWTGFLGHPNTPRDHAADRPKMLWDWLDLLLVPVVLAGAGAFINFEQSQREAKHADERAEVDREIGRDAQRERTLQEYLGAMTTLMLDEDLFNRSGGAPSSPEQVVAATRTLSTLSSLDGARKAS